MGIDESSLLFRGFCPTFVRFGVRDVGLGELPGLERWTADGFVQHPLDGQNTHPERDSRNYTPPRR
jgi:hypothetical protein